MAFGSTAPNPPFTRSNKHSVGPRRSEMAQLRPAKRPRLANDKQFRDGDDRGWWWQSMCVPSMPVRSSRGLSQPLDPSARSQSGSSSCRLHRPMKASTSRSPVSVAGRDPAKTDLNHSPVGSEVARWGRGCGGPGVGSAGGAPVGGRTADRAGRARQRGADTEPRAGVALLPIRCLDS